MLTIRARSALITSARTMMRAVAPLKIGAGCSRTSAIDPRVDRRMYRPRRKSWNSKISRRAFQRAERRWRRREYRVE